MSKVIVAGSVITDISVIVENHPQIGETVIGNKLRYSPGGKGANQAVSAKRLGADVVFICRVGYDQNGENSVSFLNNEEIEVLAYIDYESDKPTGIAMIVVSEKTGDNNIVVVTGANDDLNNNNIDGVPIESGDILVAQCETPLETTKYFFEKGRKIGTINIFNPAPVPIESFDKFGIKVFPKALYDILNLTDILILNETELEKLFKVKYIDKDWIKVFKRSNIIVIITLGDKGCVCYVGKNYITVDGIKTNVVDTTGAGDCFVGAIAAFVAENGIKFDLDKALDFANKAASLSVGKMGSGVSMPFLKDI